MIKNNYTRQTKFVYQGKYVLFDSASSTNKCQNKQGLIFLSSSCESIMIMLTRFTCSDTYMIYGRRRKYCMLP